jgi:SAM-dependent methyltransferase
MKDDIDYIDIYNEVEDFTAYRNSIIWDFSNKYYQYQGISAWSEKVPKPIPHRIGSNYQNALNLAYIIKERFKDKNEIKVLECGCGPGKFARHFLFALRELGIDKKVHFVISDFSQRNLDDIAEKKILAGFNNYELRVLDLSAKDLALGDHFDFIFLHYVLDAMPVTILKNFDGKFKELYVKTRLPKNHEVDVFRNPFLLARLELEDDYRDSFDLNPELMKFYKSYYKGYDKEIYFHETSINALKQLLASLTKDGFLYSADIDIGGNKRYLAVGNSLSHPVDNLMLSQYFDEYESFLHQESSLTRLVFANQNIDELEELFTQKFQEEKNIERLIEIEDRLDEKLDRDLLEELSTLSPYSAKTYFYWFKYFKANQDYHQAQNASKKVLSLDFWLDC